MKRLMKPLAKIEAVGVASGARSGYHESLRREGFRSGPQRGPVAQRIERSPPKG